MGTDAQQAALAHFLVQTGADQGAFSAAYALCGAQRNLRILGVFARLSIRDQKRNYPDLLPRVWRNLIDDLEHQALAPVRALVLDHFPEPSAEIIRTLKAAHV